MTTRRKLSPRASAPASAAEKSKRERSAAPPPATLTERLRALYEETTVPVAEIARLAGVTERTIYNYARKFRWRPRVLRAGRGLRSLDPAGLSLRAAEARARLMRGRNAIAIVAAARARDTKKRVGREARTYAGTLAMLNATLVELAAMRAERARDFGRRERPADRAVDRLTGVVLAAIDRLAANARSRIGGKTAKQGL